MKHVPTIIHVTLATALMGGLSATAFAHTKKSGEDSHAEADAELVQEQKAWGIAAAESKATRTVEVAMKDTMEFVPASISVEEGETVKFVVTNEGQLMHEFVLGTTASNDEHAEMMMKFPGMEHDEPYMAHVEPGKTQELTWTFNRAGDFAFACLIAGHYQAGMVGDLDVDVGPKG